jgi:hypothetical protein
MRLSVAVILISLLVVGCRLDHGLEPTLASWSGIEGTVSFVGEWLGDLEEIRVAVYREYPPADSSDLFEIAGFSDPHYTAGVSGFSYRVPLVEGIYKWVAVAGRAGASWLEDIVFLGQYVASPGDSTPAPVRVYRNMATREVDIRVDFDRLPEPPTLGGRGHVWASPAGNHTWEAVQEGYLAGLSEEARQLATGSVLPPRSNTERGGMPAVEGGLSVPRRPREGVVGGVLYPPDRDPASQPRRISISCCR